MTAQEIITSSLRLCGAIAAREVPTADEFEDGFAALVRVLQSWTISGLMPHATLDQTFTLVQGVTSYTIGPGASFDGYRPIRVRAVKINGCDIPTANIEYNATFPVATISVPEGSTGTVVITSELAFTLPTYSTDEILMPPGYEDALIYTLAGRLAPEYGIEPMASVLAQAQEMRAEIKRANIKRNELVVPPEMQSQSRGYAQWGI